MKPNARPPVRPLPVLLLLPGLLLPGLVLGACGGRTVWGSWDAGSGGDATPPQDATPPRDSGPRPDAGVCEDGEHWELTAAPVHEAWVLSPHGWTEEGMAEGISVRLHVGVAVGGCDRLAGVRVAVDSEARQVHLQSYLWVYHGTNPCPEVLRVEREIWALPYLTPGEWTLWDDFSMDGPGALASFEIRECMDGEDCQCFLWDGEPGTHGANCQFDCQCAWPLACVYEGMLDPQWGGLCAETCSVDSDCPLPLRCVLDAFDVPEGFCAMDRDTCTSSAQCPEGHTCQPGPYDDDRHYCQPAMEVLEELVRCEDDCDCPWGYACVSTSDTMTRACQIPCRGNGDCPTYLMCEQPGSYWQYIQVCSGWWD